LFGFGSVYWDMETSQNKPRGNYAKPRIDPDEKAKAEANFDFRRTLPSMSGRSGGGGASESHVQPSFLRKQGPVALGFRLLLRFRDIAALLFLMRS